MASEAASAATEASPRPRYDCSRILHEVSDQEAIYQTRNDLNNDYFGHPEPPNLHLFSVKNNKADGAGNNCDVLLVVAYTAHHVFVQPMTTASSLSDPLEVCRLTHDDDKEEDDDDHDVDEHITCLTVVSLNQDDIVVVVDDDDDSSHQSRMKDEEYDVTIEEQKGSEQATLLKGVISPTSSRVGSSQSSTRVAIVIGTNTSRVYSVELKVDAEQGACLAMDENEELPHSLFEVLPRDDDILVDRIERRRRSKQSSLLPFQSSGGVWSMAPFYRQETFYVWITYRDGTLLRLHSAGFFPSVWQKGAAQEMSLDDLLGCRALVRCHVFLPEDDDGDREAVRMVVPLPRYHASPLAALAKEPWRLYGATDSDDDTSRELTSEDEEEGCSEVFEALVFGDSASSPTLTFYTSEIQFGTGVKHGGDSELMSSSDHPVIGAVVGGTKAIVGGVVGALRWSVGVSRSQTDDDAQEEVAEEDDNDEVSMDDSMDVELASAPFPSLWHEPVGLFAGQELRDSPRQIEFCSVDPDGQLAAVTDNLGRVLLIDLETKQVIRLWKGYREASCHWMQAEKQGARGSSLRTRPSLYLAIHSRQRRVIDVYHARQGPRVCSMQVDRCADVISFSVGSHPSQLVSAFVIHSKMPGVPLNQMEEIHAVPSTLVDHSTPRPIAAKSVPPTPSRAAAVRLQHLRQLLSTKSVQFTTRDVYEALKNITSLSDLATALDLIAESAVLEEKLSVEGSDFQRMAVLYCTETLDTAMKAASEEARTNPHVKILSRKIDYHSQVINAYDLLHKFEAAVLKQEYQKVKNPSLWVMEATGWANIYDDILGTDLDKQQTVVGADKARFCEFASACVYPDIVKGAGSRLHVYFSDSSRTRRDVLVHVFKPLLADIFSFNVVFSIFDALGVRDDHKYLLQCFGEWTTTLPLKTFCDKGLMAPRSPMLRFLQEMVTRQLEQDTLSDDEVVLGPLHSFCSESTDLVRAFLLAVLCQQAVVKVSARKEKATYGKISSSRVTKDWDDVLRRLRVCLLVSFRLKDARLAAPISIRNVGDESTFSVYEWLALDELSMSHKQEEIVSLELACKMSSLAFDPSTSGGDGPSRFKMLRNSCLSAAIGEDERAEYLIDFEDEDRFGALLLFFRSHNEPRMLVAHRAKLLASMWSKEPHNLEMLHDSFAALSFLQESQDMSPLLVGVCLEIWQSSICPVYRAHLFGFDDVQELSQDVVAPLLQNDPWFTEFGKISLQLLTILKTVWKEDDRDAFLKSIAHSDSTVETWPPVRTDFVLKSLVDKLRMIDESALDAHTAVVCSLLVSKDIATLVKCVPAIYECFLPFSLFNPLTQPSADMTSVQHDFLEDSVIARAQSYNGPAMETLELGEIETLTNVWKFDPLEIRTLFLLAMYEVGKDRIVDELLTKSSLQMNVRRFVEEGVDIACRRLNAFLRGRQMQEDEMRDTMGLLDADLCEWIEDRAKKSRPLVLITQTDVPMGQTHLFALRLLSLSASWNVDTTLRVKIHSMVVCSGTLLKVLEVRMQERQS